MLRISFAYMKLRSQSIRMKYPNGSKKWRLSKDRISVIVFTSKSSVYRPNGKPVDSNSQEHRQIVPLTPGNMDR